MAGNLVFGRAEVLGVGRDFVSVRMGMPGVPSQGGGDSFLVCVSRLRVAEACTPVSLP
jgi:hypothetical protein